MDTTTGRVPSSYGYNRSLSPDAYGIKANNGNALASLNAPANIVLLFEVVGSTANVNDTPGTKSWDNVTFGLDNDSFSGDGGDNNGFAQDTGSGNYDTGQLGGHTLVSNGSKNLTGRHTDGSNFLMTDGHVKWLRGTAVSSGSPAANATDAQGVSDNTNSAAGTGVSGYVVTFSPQ